MDRTSLKQGLAVSAAVGLVTLGIAAPAFAEGRQNGHMEKWTDGDRGSTWHDSNIDNVITRVVFYSVCRHDFDARIRKERFGPDGTVGSERINCTSYDDAVYGGDEPADDYHFDVSEYTCSVAACFYPYLTGDYTEHW